MSSPEHDTIPGTILPSTFLQTALPTPPILEHIDFSTSIPNYEGCYAALAHNVLTPEECKQLLAAAAASSDKGSGWERATINSYGKLVLDESVRSCDRIIWDNQEVISRVWKRCEALFLPDIQVINGNNPLHIGWGARRGVNLRFTRPNERMRYLRYGPGEYFAPHMDGVYQTPDKKEQSFFTMHLYLNDDEHQEGDMRLKGGATSFLSHWDPDRSKKLDVVPKMGSVLVFHHEYLIHAGDELESGIKYTLRTDLLYERV